MQILVGKAGACRFAAQPFEAQAHGVGKAEGLRVERFDDTRIEALHQGHD